MGCNIIAFQLVLVFVSFGVYSLELVANYKFWDSASDQIIYDYSGKGRHGQMYYNFMFTDRGITPRFGYYARFDGMSLTSNPVQGYSDFILSFWALRLSDYCSVYNYIFENSDYPPIYHEIYYYISSSTTNINYYQYYYYGNHNYYSSDNFISGWNLYTIRIYSDPSNMTQRSIGIYINLTSLTPHYYYNDYNNYSPPALKSFRIELYNTVILYEVWAHAGFSSINDLNYLIYNNCPTSPSNYCLPEYNPNSRIMKELIVLQNAHLVISVVIEA
jgi:hypothetical protein